MKRKLALITSGGGMKCIWGVGVMLALAEQFNLRNPDILISGSGSAGTGAYYVSQQMDSIRNIWLNLLTSKRFADLRRFWRIIDVNYLIDEIFKNQETLDVQKVRESQTAYFIPALNRETGEIAYFSNREGVDLFEAMRATKAVPVAFNLDPRVALNGGVYCDSHLTSNPQTHVEKAVREGAEKILIVDNSSNACRRGKVGLDHFVFNTWLLFQNKLFRRNYRLASKRSTNYVIPDYVSALMLRPRKPVEIGTIDNDPALLRRTLEQGYEEASSNQHLKSFLEI